MNVVFARRLVVILSLGTLLLFTALLILAPVVTTIITSGQAFSLVQILFPVFAGYVGSAAAFVVMGRGPTVEFVDEGLATTIIWGVFAVFWFLGIALFTAFYLTNQPGGPQGMSVSDLASYLALFLALLNATVGAISTSLYRVDVLKMQEQVRAEAAKLAALGPAPAAGDKPTAAH